MDQPTKVAASVAQAVAARIRDGIVTGRYALGQRLIEADLIRDFDIGRGTAREVLLRLANEELVTLVQNRGAVVRRLTRAEVEELFQIRELLEGLAASRAAERIDQMQNRQMLIDVWHTMQQVAKTQHALNFEAANRDFHGTIWEISGSSQLIVLLNRTPLLLFAAQFRSGMDLSQLQRAVHEHKQIAEAILAADAPGARQAMSAHIAATGRFVIDMPGAFAT